MIKNLKSNLKNYFSSETKAVFIIMLVLLSVTLIICGMRKTIIVSIDGKETKVVTFGKTIKDALLAGNIAVASKDKTIPALDSNVEDGEKVYLRKAVSIIVEHDGKKDTIQTAEADIQTMLLVENKSISKINPFDKITPAVTTAIEPNMDIKITRVDSTIKSVTENIDYATEVKADDNMERGQEKVIQEGQTGEKVITTRVSYEDKKEVDRSVTEEVVRQPVTKVLAQGTLGVLQLASRGDSKTYYKSTFGVKATAYSANFSSTGKMPGDSFYGKTASGTTAKRDANGFSTIAVDPSVIPIGTKLYVEGYGFATAEDTGGAIIGKRIDVFFNDDSEAQNWGVRWVNVYILK